MNIDYKVETYVMKEFEEIHQHVFIGKQKLATEVMSLRDKATREALIKMGWTPPELKKYIFTVFDVEDDDEVDTYELLAESREFAFRIITHIEEFDVDHYYRLFKVEDI